MAKVRNIRVDDTTWARWTAEASAAGFSVSALIRVRMGGVSVEASGPVALRPGEVAPVPLEVKRMEALPPAPKPSVQSAKDKAIADYLKKGGKK